MEDVSINRALLEVLENQITRTDAAFEDLPDPIFRAEPGGDCNSILAIGRHLVGLRLFQLRLLEVEANQEIDPKTISTLPDLLSELQRLAEQVRAAVRDHDPQDWFAAPEAPRPGPWGDEPTIARFVRPLNDFTNHLGAVRAIRRSMGSPAERVQ
jgi:hypothetical protein